MSDIPMGWTTATISDITEYLSRGKQPKYTNYSTLPVINQRAIRWTGIQNEYLKYVDPLQFDVWEPERFIQDGDILWNSTGTGTLGRACLVTERDLEPPKVVDSHVTILRPNKTAIDPRYIFFWIQSSEVQDNIVNFATGATNQIELSRAVIASMNIPIAPLSEQKNIVDKLDSLLALVDACRDRLHKVPIILKCFRQSILVAATSGQFTEENWLETESDTVTILLLSQVVKQLKTGPFGSVLHRSDYVHNGVPLVNPMHINAGRITPSNDITISREKAEELREYQLKKGDIVIARRGVMGRCAVVGTREQGWLCGSGSMIIRTTDQILPEYLQLVLSSPNIVRDLESNAVGSTMVNLNQQIILNLKIPVPSIVKQKLIINHVRVLFLLADRIEEYHQNAIKQVEQLTPTLLSKAFCGELVPQDPNDEPAAILLDRIHAERIANPSILKRDLITRKPKMTKMTNESVKKIIDELPSDAFSFEDLHKKLAGDYDSFKDILFELLDEDEPSIEQMFDKQAKAIHFIRKQK